MFGSSNLCIFCQVSSRRLCTFCTKPDKIMANDSKEKINESYMYAKALYSPKGTKENTKMFARKGQALRNKKITRNNQREKKIRQTTQIEKRSILESFLLQSFLRLQLYAVISNGLES